MFRKIVAAFGLMAFAAYAQATPITITQTYSRVSYDDYGVSSGAAYGQKPVDEWTFKGTVDSNAVNISPWGDIGAYQLSGLTLTQASLGLFDIGITNAPVLYFYPDRVGFAFNVNGATPWTTIVYEADHFSSAHTLAEYLALLTTPVVNHSYTSFGPQWDGFALEDGRRIYGWGRGIGSTTVSTVSSDVPEPTSLALVFVALSLLGYGMRRSKAR